MFQEQHDPRYFCAEGDASTFINCRFNLKDFAGMVEENKDGKGFNINLSLGKEIDAALAEVVRSLFKRPAEEAGNLIGDSIGIFADRIRRKREYNTRLGIEQVKKQLETSNVNLDDIEPPKEEDLYLLFHGMSLAEDDEVREMWAGLFAKALDPKSGVNVERPFVSVLESLSALDVKIIFFITFCLKAERDLRHAFKHFNPKDYANITPEEKERMQSIQDANRTLASKTFAAMASKADDFGLQPIPAPGWAENLMRQGVLQRVPLRSSNPSRLEVYSLDERGIESAFGRLINKINEMEKASQHVASLPERLYSGTFSIGQFFLEVRLSSFGNRLAAACGLL